MLFLHKYFENLNWRVRMSNVKLPANLFCEVFGNYIPRLCVDTIVIGPTDKIEFKSMSNELVPSFTLVGPHGVALKERDEQPRLHQWGLPGGTVFKGERLAEASKRIIRADLGLEIDILGCLGNMEFPNEKREINNDSKKQTIIIDSISIVLLARARSEIFSSRKAKVGWFLNKPPVPHEYHTPFLEKRGLLI